MKEALLETCIIKGVGHWYYHRCSTKKLQEAKKIYSDYKYIGTGTIWAINGVLQFSDKQHHFFRKQ